MEGCGLARRGISRTKGWLCSVTVDFSLYGVNISLLAELCFGFLCCLISFWGGSREPVTFHLPVTLLPKCLEDLQVEGVRGPMDRRPLEHKLQTEALFVRGQLVQL